MLTEHKLQVYLPKQLYKGLSRAAQAEGKTIAQVVRESLAAYLARPPEQRLRDAYDSLDRLVGVGRDDGSGASEKHDAHLGGGRW